MRREAAEHDAGDRDDEDINLIQMKDGISHKIGTVIGEISSGARELHEDLPLAAICFPLLASSHVLVEQDGVTIGIGEHQASPHSSQSDGIGGFFGENGREPAR